MTLYFSDTELIAVGIMVGRFFSFRGGIWGIAISDQSLINTFKMQCLEYPAVSPPQHAAFQSHDVYSGRAFDRQHVR